MFLSGESTRRELTCQLRQEPNRSMPAAAYSLRFFARLGVDPPGLLRATVQSLKSYCVRDPALCRAGLAFLFPGDGVQWGPSLGRTPRLEATGCRVTRKTYVIQINFRSQEKSSSVWQLPRLHQPSVRRSPCKNVPANLNPLPDNKLRSVLHRPDELASAAASLDGPWNQANQTFATH